MSSHVWDRKAMHRTWHHHSGITHGIAGVGCACGWQDPAGRGEAAGGGFPHTAGLCLPYRFLFRANRFHRRGGPHVHSQGRVLRACHGHLPVCRWVGNPAFVSQEPGFCHVLRVLHMSLWELRWGAQTGGGAVGAAWLPAEAVSTTEVRRAPEHWQGFGSPSEHSLSLWMSFLVCLGCVLIICCCVINTPRQWLGIGTVIYFTHESAIWLGVDRADRLCSVPGPGPSGDTWSGSGLPEGSLPHGSLRASHTEAG